MPLSALIFDFDGTILDTETPEVRTWQSIFRDHGAEFPDEYWMHAIGRGADQIDKTPIELLEDLGVVLPDRGDVLARYEALRMADILASEVRPGIRALIGMATDRDIPMGVASSSHHSWVDGHLERLGLLGRFRTVVCADDVARAKPFPDLYQEATRRLGQGPEDCLAIEDSPNGILAAKTAGLRCLAIPNPCTARLNLSGADVILESAADVDWDLFEQLFQVSD